MTHIRKASRNANAKNLNNFEKVFENVASGVFTLCSMIWPGDLFFFMIHLRNEHRDQQYKYSDSFMVNGRKLWPLVLTRSS